MCKSFVYHFHINCENRQLVTILKLRPTGEVYLFLYAVINRYVKIGALICRATRVEEDPKVTQDIQCLWRGGGVALIQTKLQFPQPKR